MNDKYNLGLLKKAINNNQNNNIGGYQLKMPNEIRKYILKKLI